MVNLLVQLRSDLADKNVSIYESEMGLEDGWQACYGRRVRSTPGAGTSIAGVECLESFQCLFVPTQKGCGVSAVIPPCSIASLSITKRTLGPFFL
jgi:hypothetical protein